MENIYIMLSVMIYISAVYGFLILTVGFNLLDRGKTITHGLFLDEVVLIE